MSLEEYIQRIKDSLDIVAFIGKYVELRKAGKNWVGICPFHAEKTPSFTVSEEKGIFFCFGCHAGGDLLTFVQQWDRLDFRETVDSLGETAGLPPMEWGDKSQKVSGAREEMHRALLFAKEYYQKQYKNSLPAVEYMKKRGIEQDTTEAFELGYAPAADMEWPDILQQQGHDLSICTHTGLLLKDSQGRHFPYFRDRILFPIYDARGHLIGFGGRAIREGVQPKYLNSPEHSLFQKGKHLFGLHLAKNTANKEKEMVIVEGYMDAISLYQHGVKNVCASLGTAFTPDQAKLASRYAPALLFCYDSDTAGVQACFRAVELVLSLQMGCKVIVLPPSSKDPDDFIRKNGLEHWKILCEKAMTPWDFLWETVWNQGGRKDPLLMDQAVMTLLKKMAQYPEDLMTDRLIKRITLDTGISIRILHDRLQRLKKEGTQKPGRISLERKRSTGNVPSLDGERILLKSLIEKSDPAFHAMIFAKIEEKDFSSLLYKNLFSFLQEEYQKNGYLMNDELMMRLPDDETKRLVSELFFIEESFYNDMAVLECVLKTEENKIKKQTMTSLKEQIIQAEKEGDITLSKELREELKRIV